MGEVSVNGLGEKIKGTSALLGAGGQQGPGSFGPSASALAPGSLSDSPVDHHVSDGLFGPIVGRGHAGGGQKGKVGFGRGFVLEPSGQRRGH